MKNTAKIFPVILFLTFGSVRADVAPASNQVQVYFGEKYEPITHFGIHFLIATWRPKYSLIAAISIETADTLGGRFELRDWTFRLSGCMVGYLVKRFIFKRR